MIIEVVGKEIEKIKGDFESYLNGLNMVGEISYSQYSELYDEGTKQIQRAYELGKSELKKENAELEKENAELEKENAELEKENAELKAENEANENSAKKYAEFYFETNDQLTKAKEIIKELLNSCFGYNSKTVNYEVKAKAEQFLKNNA